MVHIVKDKNCKINGLKYLYTGEVDLQDNVCGFGTAIDVDWPEDKIEGTFLNGESHGLSMSLCMQDGD